MSGKRIDIVVAPRQGAKTGGWRVNKPVVDEAKCIACGTCERCCPDASIAVQARPNGKRAAVVDYDYCKGCGICANECPVKCISMAEEK
jgi:2-oxoacid:acceptor oxidoreductase delta subunit (pyruvate/2-ketoisovalerate family)